MTSILPFIYFGSGSLTTRKNPPLSLCSSQFIPPRKENFQSLPHGFILTNNAALVKLKIGLRRINFPKILVYCICGQQRFRCEPV